MEIYVQQMYAEGRELAVQGSFTFVAIDEEKAGKNYSIMSSIQRI